MTRERWRFRSGAEGDDVPKNSYASRRRRPQAGRSNRQCGGVHREPAPRASNKLDKYVAQLPAFQAYMRIGGEPETGAMWARLESLLKNPLD